MADLLRGTRGSVAAEFAMVMVPLLSLMLGAIEFGQYAYANSLLKDSMRDVARMAATGAYGITDLNNTVKARMARVGVTNTQMTATAKSYSQFGDIYSKTEPLTRDAEPLGGTPGSGDCFLDYDKNGVWSAETIGGSDDVLYYQVTAEYTFLFGFMAPLVGSRNEGSKWLGGTGRTVNLHASTTIRNEPFNNPTETCIQ